MGYQAILKNIGIEDESSWGASASGVASSLHVKTCTLNQDPNKTLVEDTSSTTKGRDRVVLVKNTISGDIIGYVSPRSIHHALEMVNCVRGTTSAVGTSGAMLVTYNQNTSGVVIGKTITQDRGNSQEKFSGVVGSALEISASDNIMEFTLNCVAKTRSAGLTITDTTGETIKPYSFADTIISISAGTSYNNPMIVYASNWSVKYDSGLESSHLSGSRDIQRVDPKVPTVNGKITIMHTGTTFVDGTFGCSEYYIRFDSTLTSCNGLIAGMTPFNLRIDIPRASLKTNVRNYEQAALSVEEIEFDGMVNYGLSALWIVSQTVGLNVA